MRDKRESIECPACGEIDLRIVGFLRKEVPGDPGDVYTIGVELECVSCKHYETLLDNPTRKIASP